ncbi:MAG: imidazolonepropionase [candidate division KSB1 bacterium]|nr:imidazolonepropionase [candidate division KSB1 bacterium]
MCEADLLVMNANQLLCPESDAENGSCLTVIQDGAIACYQGKIVAQGKTKTVMDTIRLSQGADVIDAEGKVIAPGFVDAHTHPIFWGTREHEFELRIQGKTYQEIAKAGGGIRFSVRQLRTASRDQLIEYILPYLDQFIQQGTTTIEAKSGYGLSLEDELKSLEVIQELNRLHPIELIPTFLGAHEIPDEYRNYRDAYIGLIIDEMLPRVAERNLAEFCDVFCEEHVFTVQESEKILLAAKQLGLKLKIHADQLTASGGAELAARLQAISADHLDYVTSEAMELLKAAGTIPVLLPGAVFFLGLTHYAPARQMITAGLPVALATDFNPGTCMTQSMPLIMTLGCTYLKMTPAEVWLATTQHAAQAVARSDQIGSLRVGAQADFVIWDIPNYRYLPYHFGVNLVHQVYKKGRLIWQNNSHQMIRGNV